MNKAIAFALAATAATAMQAATITWASGTITDSTGTQANATTAVVNGFLFLVDEQTWTDFDVEKGVADYIKTDGTAAKTPSATGTTTKKGALSMTTTADAADGMQYALVFYVDNTGKVKATKGNDQINAMGSAAVINSSGLASNSYAGGWVSVPEPTTLALLALGLAAVGLKRKVA